MTSRLDKLLELLETGSTASTRKAAATQIGEVVKVHPDELQMLMCRVHTCLRSKSWDTRIAAGEAFEAIAGNVPQWNPPGKARQPSAAAAAAAAAAEVEAEADGGEDEMFRFETFNVLKVLAHAQPLLGSKGLEYELDAATMALDPKARLKKQRQMLKSQLAHGEDSDILEKGAPSGFEGFLDNDDVMASRTDKRKRDDVEDTPAAQIVPAIDFTGMSARERNQAKRLAKQNAMKKGREANMVAPSSSAAAAAAGGARATTVTEQTDPGKMVVETHLDADQLGNTDAAPEKMAQHHARWIEDMAIRLLCVCALDHFGDFVTDEVTVNSIEDIDGGTLPSQYGTDIGTSI
eukprot:gene22496-14279_t